MTYKQVTADFDANLLDHDTYILSIEKLAYYCGLFHQIVGKTQIEQEAIVPQTVSSYYKISSFLYRNFHSSKGAMHLPIAENSSQRHEEKLLFQAKKVAEHIQKRNYKQVLELGCGMGFNSNYLANKFKDVQFTAIDLTPQNIQFAKKNTPRHGNINFLLGDFDDIVLQNKTFDLIFGIETLCHSKDINALLKRLKPLLNPGGKIVIFDGYIKPSTYNLQEQAQKDAYKLICWGFAMDRFQTVLEVLEGAEQVGLQVVQTVDYSKNVLSNLLAFQKGAFKVLSFPYLLKLLKSVRLLPDAVMKQVAAGLLSAHFVQENFIGYYLIEIENQDR